MSIKFKNYKSNNPVNKVIKKTKEITKKNNPKQEKKGISIITVTNNDLFIDNIFNNYDRQSFKHKELVIVLNKNDLNIDKYNSKAKAYENVRIHRMDEKLSLGYCLNYAINVSVYNIVAKFDDDDYYGSKYLSSSFEVFNQTEAEVIGKASHLVYFQQSELLAIRDPNRENKYVGFVNGSTLIFRKEIFKKIQFSNISIGEDTDFCRRCKKKGIKIYSTDKYHHVYIRHKSKASHTWKVSDKFLLKRFCKPIMRTKDYISYADKSSS